MIKTVLITITSALLGIICAPFAAVVIVTCWLHSWITSYRLRPLGLEKMQGMDAFMAHYPDMVIMYTFILSGLPTTEQIRSKFENIVQVRDARGKRIFHKLSQIMEKHYGLWFWKTADEVHLHDHVHLYKGIAPLNESDLKIVAAELHSASLRSDIPQWQVTLVPLKGDFLTFGLQSCLVFRLHHAISDGYTFMKFISTQFGGINETDLVPKNVLGNTKATAKLHKIFMVVYAMCSLFRMWFTGRITERNLLHGQQLDNRDHVTWAVFDLNKVKAVKNATKTTVSDVLLSSLSGAIRKHFISKNSAIPRSISCIVPMGRYKSSSEYKLQNSILILRLCLPINFDDPVERLRAMKCAFDKLKRSPDIVAEQLAVQFLLPYFPRLLLDWFLVNTNAVTIGTSSLVGPNDIVRICDHDIIVPIGFQPHNGLMGINIAFYGQMDKLYVAINADTAIIKSQEDLEMIITYIAQELEELHKKVLPGSTQQIQIPFSQLKNKCSITMNNNLQ